MTTLLPALSVATGWLGASVLTLSDARRGIAVGLLVGACGLALARLLEGNWSQAAILLIGGLLAAVASLRRNQRRGWGLLPPGSTPRIVLCVVLGGAGLWLGTGMLDGPAAWQTRAAVAILAAIGAGRMLSAGDPRASLAAASLVALAAGVGSAAAASAPAAVALGAAAAVLFNLIPTGPEAALGPERG